MIYLQGKKTKKESFMKTVGIVCEYNPFHTGHMRQIDILRESGAEIIVCAMSGNFTERGELTVADKYVRAEAAIKCGADVVVELPFPYSSLSAEGFCAAGVHILSSLGCDTISFGSESADEGLLRRAAEIIASSEFIADYAEVGKKQGSAKAYFDLLATHLCDGAKLLSNDILGISYIAAINRLNSQMEVFPIAREGAAYKETELSDTYPSATALRRAVKNAPDGFFSLGEDKIPTPALETLKGAQTGGIAPIFTDSIGSDILSFFKLISPDEIVARAIQKSGGGESVACDGCGIVDRICSSAKKARNFEEFLANSYTSRYTDARINRVILFSLLGVSDAFEKSLPEYTTLLGAGEIGRKYLSEIRKTLDFPVVTKPADAPEGALTDIIRLSDSLYASAMPKGVNFDYFLKKHPYMG